MNYLNRDVFIYLFTVIINQNSPLMSLRMSRIGSTKDFGFLTPSKLISGTLLLTLSQRSLAISADILDDQTLYEIIILTVEVIITHEIKNFTEQFHCISFDEINGLFSANFHFFGFSFEALSYNIELTNRITISYITIMLNYIVIGTHQQSIGIFILLS